MRPPVNSSVCGLRRALGLLGRRDLLPATNEMVLAICVSWSWAPWIHRIEPQFVDTPIHQSLLKRRREQQTDSSPALPPAIHFVVVSVCDGVGAKTKVRIRTGGTADAAAV